MAEGKWKLIVGSLKRSGSHYAAIIDHENKIAALCHSARGHIDSYQWCKSAVAGELGISLTEFKTRLGESFERGGPVVVAGSLGATYVTMELYGLAYPTKNLMKITPSMMEETFTAMAGLCRSILWEKADMFLQSGTQLCKRAVFSEYLEKFRKVQGTASSARRTAPRRKKAVKKQVAVKKRRSGPR